MQSGKERQYDGGQSGAFDKSGGDQHSRTDITYSLGLTSDSIHGLATNLSDTEACTDNGQTCTDCC